MNDQKLHVAVPRPLVEDAKRHAPGLSLAGLVRVALAKLAGWPESAQQAVAVERRGGPRNLREESQ